MALNIEVTGAPAASSCMPCLVGPIGPWQGCPPMMDRWLLLLLLLLLGVSGNDVPAGCMHGCPTHWARPCAWASCLRHLPTAAAATPSSCRRPQRRGRDV